MRRFIGPILTILCLVTTSAWAAPTPKSALAPADESFQYIPANSIIVVQLNGHERIKQRMTKMIENALPDQAKQIGVQIDKMIGEVMQGRDLKAIRSDARIYLALSDLTKLPDTPEVVVLLPIKDYDDFKKSFLTDDERKTVQKEKGFEAVSIEDIAFYMAPVKGYISLCTNAETAKKISDGKAGGLNSAMSKDTLQAFMDSDVSLFVNVKEINAIFGEQIKQFKGVASGLFNGGGGFGLQGINKSQMDLIKALIDNVFQMVEDGVGFVLALDVRPEGLNLRLLEQFGEKSPTAEALKTSKGEPLTELASLPSGQMSYTVSKLKLQGLTAQLFNGGIAADDEKEETKTKIQKSLKELEGLEITGNLATNQALNQGALQIVDSKDAKKMLATQVDIIKLLGDTSTYANVNIKEKPVVTANALKVADWDLTKIEVKFDLDKTVASLPEEIRETTKTTMKRMLGGETVTTWLAATDKQFITVSAKDAPAAKKLLEQYLDTKKSIGTDPAFQFTRRQLPADASVMMMFDAGPTLASMYGSIKDSVGAVPGLPIMLPELKAKEMKTALIGIAVVLKPEHGSVDVFIPVSAVAEIRKFLGPIFDMDN